MRLAKHALLLDCFSPHHVHSAYRGSKERLDDAYKVIVCVQANWNHCFAVLWITFGQVFPVPNYCCTQKLMLLKRRPLSCRCRRNSSIYLLTAKSFAWHHTACLHLILAMKRATTKLTRLTQSRRRRDEGSNSKTWGVSNAVHLQSCSVFICV